MDHGTVALTAREALSGIFGSISLVAWIVVLVPQLLQNYFASSAEAISLTFLLIWFLGDVANLSGALWARLVPTVTALAVYFCFADAILISQCLYYNMLNKRRKRSMSTATVDNSATGEDDEEEPLLSRRGSPASNIGLPGSRSRRRSSATSRRTQTGSESSAARRRESMLAKISEEDGRDSKSGGRAWLKNIASILIICLVGTAGWAIAWKVGVWTPAATLGDQGGEIGEGKRRATPLGAEALGYLSAIAYLGARIPQILKNWRDKSCEGLSLLFFLLSLLGNLTYGAGILFHSTERQYVVTNLPWLIGSLGTMAEDVTIFIQFHIYGEESSSDEAVE